MGNSNLTIMHTFDLNNETINPIDLFNLLVELLSDEKIIVDEKEFLITFINDEDATAFKLKFGL